MFNTWYKMSITSRLWLLQIILITWQYTYPKQIWFDFLCKEVELTSKRVWSKRIGKESTKLVHHEGRKIAPNCSVLSKWAIFGMLVDNTYFKFKSF